VTAVATGCRVDEGGKPETCSIRQKFPVIFAILAEGPLEQIRQLQAQVDEFVHHLEAALA
jgi:hypothetical protein